MCICRKAKEREVCVKVFWYSLYPGRSVLKRKTEQLLYNLVAVIAVLVLLERN
jgi:hypothetical protein